MNNYQEIQEILQHRYPFLHIDKIVEVNKTNNTS